MTGLMVENEDNRSVARCARLNAFVSVALAWLTVPLGAFMIAVDIMDRQDYTLSQLFFDYGFFIVLLLYCIVNTVWVYAASGVTRVSLWLKISCTLLMLIAYMLYKVCVCV